MDERYYSFSYFCKKTFGRKLYRVALDAHMTCPNRDGKIDTRGCIFCSKKGSGEFAISFDGQPLEKKDFIYNHDDGKEGDYIAYFQAYTNTYAPIERLRRLYTSVLDNPNFQGISIATRPDCMDDTVIALLKELKEKYPNKFFMVELGLQTIHKDSSTYIRRGYELKIFEECMDKLKDLDIHVVVHVILGLPNESKEMMLETIRYLNKQPIHGIKLQLLHYLKDTDLGDTYNQKKEEFHVLSFEEYIDIVVTCIQELRSDIVIHRLSGDGKKDDVIAPQWAFDKKKVLNTIRHTLKERDIVQGKAYEA